jgi:signal transduction histidine kinase
MAILIIVLISSALSVAFANYVFTEKFNMLEASGLRVNQWVNEFHKNQITKKEFENFLNTIGLITDSSIQVIQYNEETIQELIQRNPSSGYLVEDLNAILNNNTVIRRNQYSESYALDMVFVGIPLKINANIQGAIILLSPVNNLTDNIVNIVKIIWFMSLATILCFTILIYYVSYRISSPIQKMDAAARKIANGVDIHDIDIQTKDELQRLAHSFNTMKKKLDKTERIRKEFIASISHDIRTPLTSIKGFIQGMMDGLIDTKDHPRYLQIIMNETNRLVHLTGDILDIAKMQSGHIELKREQIKMNDFLPSIVNLFELNIKEKSIRLSLRIQENVEIFADRSRMEQIVSNVLSNAIKYHRISGHISMDCYQKDNFCHLEIKDDGLGIPEKDLMFVFDKFYQVDKVRKKDSVSTGSGLGLNIVKSLVQLHHGEISIESQIHEGTQVYIRIPLR